MLSRLLAACVLIAVPAGLLAADAPPETRSMDAPTAEAAHDAPREPADQRAADRASQLLSAATDALRQINARAAAPQIRMHVAEGLALIAAQYAKLGQMEAAKPLIDDARDLAATLREDPPAMGLANQAIVEAQLALGLIREAMVTAQATASNQHAARIWGAIAAAQWLSGDEDSSATALAIALERADGLEDPNDGGPPPSDRARTYIAERQIEVGHLANASTVIHRMVDANEKAHALAVVASVLARHGHATVADKMLKQSILTTNIINGGLWKWTSPWVAKAHAQLDDLEAAAQAATASDQPLAAIFVAQAHADRGNRTEAAPWIKQAEERLAAIKQKFASQEVYEESPTDWLWEAHDMGLGRVLADDDAAFRAWVGRHDHSLSRAYAALGGAEALVERAFEVERLTLVQPRSSRATLTPPNGADGPGDSGQRPRRPGRGSGGGRRPRN
jgi:hypothetical protein